MNLRLSSSVCYADYADDIDMGDLGQDALIRSLGGLMLASKAMGRAALMLIVDAEPEWHSFLARLHNMETRWSRQLRLAITGMDAALPPDVDGLHQRIVQHPDPIDRFAAIRDELERAVAELDMLLPRIRHETLQESLRMMRADLRVSLAQAARSLAAKVGDATSPAITD
ncbi:MAG TPA: DUF6306 domain-containing protein [Acetobacteraceae bacterium]|nr:DUF6306 domain-containing protein [Acetobacteraceae bacterium]